MTLYERAQRMESAKGSATGKGSSTNDSAFVLLRNQVRQLISADEIAAMARANPSRARNEVRSACRRAFEKPSWIHFPLEERARLADALIDSIFGFGPIEDLIEDPSITEVMVNGPSKVFFERDGRIFLSDRSFEGEDDLVSLIDRVLGPLGRRVDEASPMVNARLPQGYRMNVVMPPVAVDGPLVTIRKFADHVISLEDMVAENVVEPSLKTFLEWAVVARRNIAVSGGTGSGKTTLLNALSCVVPHDERVVTIEDSAELRFLEHPHVLSLEARPRNAEGLGEITIRDLVTNALRMRPDRIVIGECRGTEALDMLQAMNTGHAGSLTTLHANSPEESISRLVTMVRYGADLPVDVIEANIASALDLVVQTKRSVDGLRYVSSVVELFYDAESSHCEARAVYRRNLASSTGKWESCPDWIDGLCELGCSDEKEVASWKRRCLFS